MVLPLVERSSLLHLLRSCLWSGESYGGQYITMLTDRTLERNRQGARPTINIRVSILLFLSEIAIQDVLLEDKGSLNAFHFLLYSSH